MNRGQMVNRYRQKALGAAQNGKPWIVLDSSGQVLAEAETSEIGIAQSGSGLQSDQHRRRGQTSYKQCAKI